MTTANTQTTKITYRDPFLPDETIEVTPKPLTEMDNEAFDAVNGAAKGSYQQDLLNGRENWSGSSLRGAANSKHGASYHRSRMNLLDRINSRLPAGWDARTGLVLSGSPKRWRRELILTSPDNEIFIW